MCFFGATKLEHMTPKRASPVNAGFYGGWHKACKEGWRSPQGAFLSTLEKLMEFTAC
jgi:hypothetical protein